MRNIAVIGCGYWGKNLVRVFDELEALKTVCDIKEGILENKRIKYPHVGRTADMEDIFRDDSIDSVVIATPASTHYSLVKKSLLNKKNVFVEKPLALAIEEGRELVALSKSTGKILMVGHILCYHPAVVKLKELILSGELGEVEYIYSNRLNMGMLRHEENIIWSFAPHDVSAILMLLGEFPSKIHSFGGEYLQKGKGIFDTTLTALEFESGVKAHIFVSWLHPFKEQRLVVVGDKKMALFDDLTEEKLFLYSRNIEWNNHIPTAKKAAAEPVKIDMQEPLKLECRHFIDCVNNKRAPQTDGEEGLRTLSVLSLAEESLRKNEKVNYVPAF